MQVSQASFSVPMVQFFEQSREKLFAKLYKANRLAENSQLAPFTAWDYAICRRPKLRDVRRV